jgi:hypothetical protein
LEPPWDFPLLCSVVPMTRVTQLLHALLENHTPMFDDVSRIPMKTLGNLCGISQPCLIASRYDGNIVLIAGAWGFILLSLPWSSWASRAGLRRRLAHRGLRKTKLSRSAEVVLGGETKGIAAPWYILMYRVDHFFDDHGRRKKGVATYLPY